MDCYADYRPSDNPTEIGNNSRLLLQRVIDAWEREGANRLHSIRWRRANSSSPNEDDGGAADEFVEEDVVVPANPADEDRKSVV